MKKIISLLLIVTIVCSFGVAIFATNDYSQGTQVKYTGQSTEEYTITVPAELKPGQSGTVTLSGTWADDRVVHVTADETVTLTNSINANDQKVLDVTFAGISEKGSNTGIQTFTEPVSVSAIQNALFGIWSGRFYYNVEIGNYEISLPDVGKSAEEYTWAEIKVISEAGKGDEYFNLGDTKTFTTTDGKTIVMEIVAFNADTKADGTGTAGITWISKEFLATNSMNAATTNLGGWLDSEMRTWLQNDVYSTLPNDVQNVITNVNKTYYDFKSESTLICEDSVWLPSAREVFGGDTYENSGVDYTNHFTDELARKKGGLNWWLRSAAGSYDGDNSFSYVNGNGYAALNWSNAKYGVVLGFCT